MVISKIDFELFTLSDFMVERILSGRFCPLTALLRLSRFSARSAHMLCSRSTRQRQGLDLQGQARGPRTWVQWPKTRNFDLDGIYHATNTKSFKRTGVVRILCTNGIIFVWWTGQHSIISRMWFENNHVYGVAHGDGGGLQKSCWRRVVIVNTVPLYVRLPSMQAAEAIGSTFSLLWAASVSGPPIFGHLDLK